MDKDRKLYTGTVVNVELREFDHPRPSPYRQWAEQRQVKLLVSLETAVGQVWFYTPPVDFSINAPPGAGVAVCTISPDDGPWIGAKEMESPTGNAIGQAPVSRVFVGQVLTITGRVKKQTRHGTQLNYVRLVAEWS